MDLIILEKNNKDRCFGNFNQKSVECWDTGLYRKDRCGFWWDCAFSIEHVQEIYLPDKDVSILSEEEFEAYEEQYYRLHFDEEEFELFKNGEHEMNRFEFVVGNTNEEGVETKHAVEEIHDTLNTRTPKKYNRNVNRKNSKPFEKIEGTIIPKSWQNFVDKIMSLEDVEILHKKTASIFSIHKKNFVSLHIPCSEEVLRVYLNYGKVLIDDFEEQDTRKIMIPCNKTGQPIFWTKPEDSDYVFEFIESWHKVVRDNKIKDIKKFKKPL